jgi:hypothetical protein
MTKVMRTHGLRHLRSTKRVLHFFNDSYAWEPTDHLKAAKARKRDALLHELRTQGS